jgi:hypothetical protein
VVRRGRSAMGAVLRRRGGPLGHEADHYATPKARLRMDAGGPMVGMLREQKH